MTQPFGPGWLIWMLRAATAPMLLAGPTAVMHWPTFSADGRAGTTSRYTVAAVVVTVMLVPAPAARFLPRTTKLLADSEVTMPLAPPNEPLLPLGRGLGLKLGRGENVPRGLPNPPARLQLPLAGVLMVTAVAVIDLVAPPVVEGWPATTTQLPTVTSLDVTVTVSVMAVAAVKVTVTCPVVGFCTSRLDPDTAAAVPTAPGKAVWVLAGVGLSLAPAVVLGPAPPHADTASATIAGLTRARIQRRRQLRLAADARLVVAPVMVNFTSLWCSFAAQRVDGCEPGSAGGRVDAEADAYAHRDDDRAGGGGG